MADVISSNLLKTNPVEAMARRKVEQKGPSSVLTFPKNLGAHGMLMRFFEYSYGGPKGSESKPIAEIMLPLPRQIQDSFKVNVGGDELGILGTGVAQLAGNPSDMEAIGSNLGKAVAAGLSSTASAVGKAVTGDTSGIQSALAGTADASGFLLRAGLGSVSPDIANGISVGRGTAVNPFATLVFKGVDLKVHSLEWLLSPESEEESRELKKIIRTLQRMILPKTQSPLGADADNLGLSAIDKGILRYPAMVNIYLMGVDQSYYFRFKTSMISQLNIDYSPGGISIQKGGKPSQIGITMTLNEAFIHTADDNTTSDLVKEEIAERIDARVTDNLSSTDGESRQYDASQVRSPDGSAPISNNSAGADEVTMTRDLADGSTAKSVLTKTQLKAQGFTDAQIAGTAPSGVDNVTFTPGA